MTNPPHSQIGRYRTLRELGRGTMGIVYEAQDTSLGRTVALKTFGVMDTMAPHERDAFEQRFLSEARISATLDHENVVGVYDVGRDLETGLLFMALEYVRGETLADTLARGPLPWADAAAIVIKVARALQGAHVHHIVHRDIKPANIMLTPAGVPKIMDFGIAKASASQLTVAGQVFGTPAYMSPEQAFGETVDGRSDIFSLGCVLYEMVTGVRPFEGPTMAATLNKIMSDEPSPASSLAEVPRTIDAIIGRALRKQRDDRYDSAEQMARDLEHAITGQAPMHATQLGSLDTVALSRSPPATPPPQAPDPLPTRRIARAPFPPEGKALVQKTGERFPMRIVGAVALVLALLGLGAVRFLLSPSRPEGARTPEAVDADNALNVEEAASGSTAVTPMDPTPASTPAYATPALLSAEGRGGSAKVSFDLKYPFGSASLRVKVDDRVVFASRLSGMPIRSEGVTSGYDGRFHTDLPIPPGNPLVQVEIRSGESAYIESIRVRLRAGESRHLIAVVDTTLNLSIE